jgi:hypothetical protein
MNGRQTRRESNGSRKTLSHGLKWITREDTIMTNKTFKTLAGILVLGLVCSFVIAMPMAAQAHSRGLYSVNVGAPLVYGYPNYVYTGPVYTPVISVPVYDTYCDPYTAVPLYSGYYGPAYSVYYSR